MGVSENNICDEYPDGKVVNSDNEENILAVKTIKNDKIDAEKARALGAKVDSR